MALNSRAVIGRTSDAEARLLASNIAYLDLKGLLPSNPAGSSRVFKALPGRTVFNTGDTIVPAHPYSAVLVERGAVELSVPGESGPVAVYRLGPGAVFGEIPLLGIETMGATAVAAEECQTVSVDYDTLIRMIRKSTRMLSRVVDLLGRRLVDCQADLRGSIDSRLLRRLEKLADDEGVISGIGHRELAERLRASRQTVTKALGRLRLQGLLKTSRLRITLIKEPARR
jgi:CRP-like cAMP-binding protein